LTDIFGGKNCCEDQRASGVTKLSTLTKVPLFVSDDKANEGGGDGSNIFSKMTENIFFLYFHDFNEKKKNPHRQLYVAFISE